MTTDRVVRLDPKTSQIVEYLMPTETNIRRVFVDNSTTPVTFWVGSNHGATRLHQLRITGEMVNHSSANPDLALAAVDSSSYPGWIHVVSG